MIIDMVKFVLNNALYTLIGISAGLFIAYGYISLVLSVGLIRNIVRRFRLVNHKKYVITFLVIGIVCGSIAGFYIGYSFLLANIGKIVAGVCGLFYGIFVGYLALGLAEVFDVIPVINNKLGFRADVRLIVICAALGKLFGSLICFLNAEFYNIKV